MEDRILTRHPRGKAGVNLSKTKYDAIRLSVVETLQGTSGMTYSQLAKSVSEKLKDRFEGSVPWYVEVVKLDLEASGVIQRVGKTKQLGLRLIEA